VSRWPALRIFNVLEVLLPMPTWIVVAIYLVRDLHMSPLQLVLMGTVMEAAVFLFEVPTGVVADTYSRRASLAAGFLGMGLCSALVGFTTSAFAAIVLWGLWGFSYTFTSGAYQAWLADEIGVENLGPALLRGARLGFVGSLLGLGGLVALSTVSLRASVIAGGAITIACGVLTIAFMPEHGFTRKPRGERAAPWAELAQTAKAGARFVRAVVDAVAAPVGALGSPRESYRRIHEWLARALGALGVEATLAPDGPTVPLRPSGSPSGSDGPGACFGRPAGGEIVVGGRKLVGSAQVRHRTALLQHGSILLEGSQEIIGAISRQPSAISGGTTLVAVLGRPVSFDEVAEAVVQSWGNAVTAAAPYRSLPPFTAFFSDPAWTWRR